MNKQEIFNYINKNKMIKKGDIVIVALSGGADSMALFHFFLNNKSELGITLCAAHVNHKMRKVSDEEERGVVKYCEQNGVQIFTTTLSPPENPSEEWARQERYSFFKKLIKKYNAKLATAHTASDNSETVLFRLCRGTSLRGAGGIPPIREMYIRPFLCFTREEIEDYCEENRLCYFTDETNLGTQYSRGKIRNITFPALNDVHPNAKQAFARFAESAREAQSFIDEQALLLINKAKDGEYYNVKPFADANAALSKAAIYKIIEGYGEITEKTISDCYNLLLSKRGSVNLPKGMAFSVQSKKIHILTQKNETHMLPVVQLSPGFHRFSTTKSLRCETKDYEEILNYLKVEKKGLIFYADYGRIPVDTCFRSRKGGDTFALKGRGVTKTLKKYMNEKGIVRSERDVMPLLASQSRVLWLWGDGFCDGLEPGDNTEKVLIITICDTEEI